MSESSEPISTRALSKDDNTAEANPEAKSEMSIEMSLILEEEATVVRLTWRDGRKKRNTVLVDNSDLDCHPHNLKRQTPIYPGSY